MGLPTLGTLCTVLMLTLLLVAIALTLAPLMDGFDTIAMNLCLTMPAFE